MSMSGEKHIIVDHIVPYQLTTKNLSKKYLCLEKTYHFRPWKLAEPSYLHSQLQETFSGEIF